MRKRSLNEKDMVGRINGCMQCISLDEMHYYEKPYKHYTYIVTVKCLRCGKTRQTTWHSFISKTKSKCKSCANCKGSYMEEMFKDKTGFESKYRLRFANIKSGAKKRNIYFDLTEEEMYNLLTSPCNYCGCNNSNGIDRIDSSKGYITENVVPCCAMCNRMKNNYSLEAFKTQIRKIYSHLNYDN